MPTRCRHFLIAMLAGTLLACARKVSLENYNRLHVGQTYDEVTAIVGDPASCDELLGVRTCRWGNDGRGIVIAFLAGKVMVLSARNLK
ncbi:MAG TPA: hypothetical protein PLS67_04515 [Accumulibacter sp.]|jgi:hypothetical protein|nr:hypothetical protein [Accumulibacter sp.]HQC79769.1 hypothetical protein [Accumulibacter sp.]